MKKLLIVQVGDPILRVEAKRGAFHGWITKGTGLLPAEVEVIDPRNDESLPEPTEFRGVIVTGSSSSVTNLDEWSERTANWLHRAVETSTPCLGICYGHQLLAHALGGQTGKNPNGREIGSIELQLTQAAASDPLFSELPKPLLMQATHVDTVLALPPGARLLAYNDLDPHQAFVLGENAWAVQFHPEFDAEVVKDYLQSRRQTISDEGLDPDALIAAVIESDHGRRLLKKFVELIAE